MNKLLESPCVNVCELNQDNLCTGCFRTIDEISQWSELQNKQQLEILEKCRQRESALNVS